MSREVIYTTAPKSYDGFSTREEQGFCGRDGAKIIRRVTTEAKDREWQIGRYASGLHMAITEDSFRQLVAAGVIDLPPADAIAAAAIALFHSVEQVNHGVWQVPHDKMRKLMAAVGDAGYSY